MYKLAGGHPATPESCCEVLEVRLQNFAGSGQGDNGGDDSTGAG
jgi:hypothetical protein